MAAADTAAAGERALKRPRPVDTTSTVAGAVARHARLRPTARAVIAPDGVVVSYRALTARIEQVVGLLQESGCAAGDLVAVIGPRSTDTPAVFLALETCGLVYVPLDEDWPEARVSEILHRCRPKAVLLHGTAELRDLSGMGAPAVIRLPQDGGASSSRPDDSFSAPEQCADPSSLRYVIHTSGTTGVPKGAAVEHRGMMNHLWAKVEDFGLTSDDVVAFSAPVVFDISIWQMLAPLLCGAAITVLSDSEIRFPRRLSAAVRTRGVTVAEFVPTVLGWLEEAVHDSGPPPYLRWLISTGEDLPPALARRVLTALPRTGLMNAYGPTECSDDVTHQVVSSGDVDGSHVPVGVPIPNTAIYVLVQEDSGRWRPARTGETGEMFIGGVGVGPGYLGDREATVQSYFRDDFDPASPTGRIFRTRDAAVVRNGSVYCLGRLDRQVKVSGVRMELGEIEAALGRHGGVRQCAVVLEQSTREAELIAFYVSDDVEISREELADWLSHALPRAMVPHRFVRLARLPLTANGKVDYAALSQAGLEIGARS